MSGCPFNRWWLVRFEEAVEVLLVQAPKTNIIIQRVAGAVDTLVLDGRGLIHSSRNVDWRGAGDLSRDWCFWRRHRS